MEWLVAVAIISRKPRLSENMRPLAHFHFPPVYRFIGVWHQESGKGPRLANGAAEGFTLKNIINFLKNLRFLGGG